MTGPLETTPAARRGLRDAAVGRRPNRLGPVVAAILLLASIPRASDAAAADDPERVLERFERAAAAHPDDPDLAFGRARQLAVAGRSAEALEAAHRYLARWPARRADAGLELARALLDHGSPREARVLLDREIQRTPGSGIAHFYRGMALRADRDLPAANRELQAAALLAPSLRSETLLVRALVLFEMNQEDEAVSLLQELLRSDPTSDTAVRARLLLRDREVLREGRRWRAQALAGFEWDDNVTLEGNESEFEASDREDFRGLWGVGLSGQPWLSDRGGLLLGYRYDQTRHADLTDFDLLQNAVFASLTLHPSRSQPRRLALRFDAQAYDTLQDLDRVVTGGSFRPNLLVALGGRAGVVRGFGAFEVAEFDTNEEIEPWKRDSLAGGLGIEHVVPIAPRGSTLAYSYAWLRSITDAEPAGGAGGFDGDFDFDSHRVRALGSFALPFSLRAQIEASYTHDDYLNDNFAHALATLENEQRRDDIVAGRIALSRPIVRHTRLELYWRGVSRISNVDVFDYDKHVVGLLVHLSTD